MFMRDEKEVVYQHIRKLSLPYTIIDVGAWHQVSFPTLPSGRVDYASFFRPNTTIHAGGEKPTILTDLRDIGHYVARIIDDERTLNQYVYTCSDVLSENEIFSMIEEMSSERIERAHVSAEEIRASIERIETSLKVEPSNIPLRLSLVPLQYNFSKFVRGDNEPVYAKYLGYLDARELYPDFKPRRFSEFLGELLQGKAEPVYVDNGLFQQLQQGMRESGVAY
ncbi:isoflavone reductase homolog P3 [Aspergillus udagawae]|uniref:Isoflavone reductase homolog P3 n=1 Tax=Aspergillus udagawae TaxID=91492 RepID=A0ABQ1AS98_9EURO|nr:isoflavone reductase homolog P3 [Aspergillus udagawae]GFF87168.1 isoflavone reductase homolog P3 [Aspergillus udagawae]GFG13192.1 isoflavone reductase homolog P3 [Aspergillus udagawae]